MRLTLRTLLAWLDDTLSPAEVREIGKQVAESPFAKELVERVHRVTRQRRLTVPNRTGPDATDPNLVASYLDNELAPEEVAEFEKRCLTSDVHLAEVASVHQILSLIGQKAKVPTEARHRMYHLIKGRESVGPKAPRASQASEPEPVSEPIQPWVTPEPPSRPFLERFGPAAAVVLMIIAFCTSAWLSLLPPEAPSSTKGAIANQPQPTRPKPAPAPAPEKKGEPIAAVGPAAPAPAAPAKDARAEANKNEPAAAEAKTDAGTTAAAEPGKDAPARPELPPGVVGLAEKPAGVLLRHNRETRQWEQLTAETQLKDQDRLLSLAPFRSTLVLGTARIDLVGETEIWVSAAPPTQAARINLVHGRVVLRGTTPAAPYSVQFAKKTIEITPPPGVALGLERQNQREPGAAVASEPTLRFFAADGEVALLADDVKEKLEGPGELTFNTRGSWSDRSSKPVPSWVTDTKPTPYDQQVGEQFLSFFRPNRPVISNLVEAADDDQHDVLRLAVAATRATGEIALIVPLLDKGKNDKKPTDSVARRAAISALRNYLAQGPDAARELRAQLQSYFGEELGQNVEKLLVGYTFKEARDEATYSHLVQDLSSPEVAVRQLALENLQSLTGRDDLGYDPDVPNDKGQRPWKDLLHNHELRPAAAPAVEDRVAPAEKASEK
jgi:hypothetical protein